MQAFGSVSQRLSEQGVEQTCSQINYFKSQCGDGNCRTPSPLDASGKELERLTHDRVGKRKDPEDEESEECFLLHGSSRAVIDTDCGRCVIGRASDQAGKKRDGMKKPSPVILCDGEDRSLGVIDLPCVKGGKRLWIPMHVVQGEVPSWLSKEWLRQHDAVIDTEAGELKRTQQQNTAPMSEGESGRHQLDLVEPSQDFRKGRARSLSSSPQTRLASPATPSRVLVACWKQMVPRCGLFHRRPL